jgi:F-type H+-transporting ATPase subunit b
MPQISQIGEIYASQLFWLAIVFALIYFGIGKAMVPRIERTIDDRAARIEGDLAAAEAARAQAQASDAAYEAGMNEARAKAAQTFAEAQAKATSGTEARLKAADADAEARLDAAMAGVRDSQRAALAEIEATVVEAAEAIVAKLSTIQPDRAELETQVKAALAHG